MRRTVHSAQIVYLHRARGWSYILLLTAGVVLLAAWLLQRRHVGDPDVVAGLAQAAALSLFLIAIPFFLRKRTLVIDRDARRLSYRDRSGLMTWGHSLALQDVSVHEQKDGGAVWIEAKDGRRLPMRKGPSPDEAHELARQLATDLDCPLHPH
ncbi:MAG TPA: hypothetical protein VE981_02215 [Planctomycetota bacterium]|nr:hypothetical protein [Planctomycetota bacterium]